MLFLPGRIKLEKVKKLLGHLYYKEEYVKHIVNLKQVNLELVLKKMHRVIKFNQKSWLKSYIDMKTELRKNEGKKLRKRHFQVDEYCSFWKNYGNCKKS